MHKYLAALWLCLLLPTMAAEIELPPASAQYDSQLGGAYEPPGGVDTLPEHFAAACETPNRNFSVILRDRNLTSPTDPAYVYRAC